MTTKKPVSKPPSMLAMVQLIRKTQLAQDRKLAALENQIGLLRLDVGHGSKQRETIETLARHAERLLREKEIVMAAVDVEDLRRKIQDANQFMAAAPRTVTIDDQIFAGSQPMPYTAPFNLTIEEAQEPPPMPRAANGHDQPLRRPAHELCGFVATHTKGVRCQVCEWTG
jgi:hypothetical protein